MVRYRWLPIASAVFLVMAMTIQFVVSYRWEERRVLEHIDYEMQLAQKDFVFEIYDIQDAGEEMYMYVKNHLDNPDDLLREVCESLKRNPDILSCYVSFRPDYYHPGEYWFCPCAYRSGDSIVTINYGDDDHDYFEKGWYQGALTSDTNGYWSPSYRDEDFADPVCTHSLRVDDGDSLACVIGIDFSFPWMNKMLEEVKPYEDAYCRLYSADGTLLLANEDTGLQTKTDKRMIVRRSKLSPMGLQLEIGISRKQVWEGVKKKSLITLLVLLTGILVAALLIRRINADQSEIMRVETANRIMEHELRIASGIQRGILKSSNDICRMNGDGGIEVQAVIEPMREVGGDLYDFYRKGDDLYFIIGDVSGKSVPAAMFMSATVNLFRSAVRRQRSPKAIMEEMNSVLSENNPSMMFVTAFIGRLHIPTGQLLYCNAGHLSPIKVRGTEVVSVLPNIPLGYDGGYRFEEQGTMLGEGDSIVLYTDGITEARNDQREMLGLNRWREAISRQGAAGCEGLLKEVKTFMANTVPVDDITLMVIRKTGGAEPLTLRVENKQDQWYILRTALHEYGLCAGLDKRTLKKMEVAVEEAVVNIVNYSQGSEIGLTLCGLADKGISVTLSDNGIPFDPTAQEPADTAKAVAERQIGGLGIALLRQIADLLHYRRTDDGLNELTIIKNI